MLNVLLADDETRTLHHLMTGVPWFQLGMEVCCTASNGSEALAFIESHPIDILITDIRLFSLLFFHTGDFQKCQTGTKKSSKSVE